MIVDAQLLLADSQAPGNIGTNLSTNTIDRGAQGTIPAAVNAVGTFPRRRGARALRALCQVDVACVGASGTCKVQIITSASANLGTPTVIASSEAIAVASLVAGYRFSIDLPENLGTQRYLGAQFVIATTNFSAGNITITLVDAVQVQN